MFYSSLESFHSSALLKKPLVASASKNCVLICTIAAVASFFLCSVQGLKTVTVSCPANLPSSVLEAEAVSLDE